MSEWIECKVSLPPIGQIIETKIHDKSGARNQCYLKRGGQNGRIWFNEDGLTYVYYEPTHWREQS
jgi:hypothetical protein